MKTKDQKLTTSGKSSPNKGTGIADVETNRHQQPPESGQPDKPNVEDGPVAGGTLHTNQPRPLTTLEIKERLDRLCTPGREADEAQPKKTNSGGTSEPHPNHDSLLTDGPPKPANNPIPSRAVQAAAIMAGGAGQAAEGSESDTHTENVVVIAAQSKANRKPGTKPSPKSAKVVTTLVAAPPSTAKAKQPASVDDWVVRITNQVAKTAQDLVELGQVFIKAKSELDHGQWEELFKPGKLRFSIRTAQKLMQVAKNTALAKAKNSALLPPSLDSLATLARLDPEVVQAGIDEGVVAPDMTIGDVKKFALDQLEPQREKPVKPFTYDRILKSLVGRVSQAIIRVPVDQREKFVGTLLKQVKELAAA